ncbi:transcription factor MYB3R-1-like [Diospyros lotus]|uniref:transcription factor MYB3R-1-like n=1 Tax=Diospyros lotus TaxID=55363 RepID=UPI00225886BC|nr:transcription factor MYB3R-1-like [Diospyros lotus]
MESDRTNTTTPDGVSNCLQKKRPLHGRTSGPARRSTKGQWTAEEDEILRKAVQRFKGKNWKKIAECFKDRTDVQCLHRWQKVLNPELIKGPWCKEEDGTIIELVNKYGPRKWSTIAQHLPGRIGKQCRERWHNHLNPNINKEAWTQEEELILIHAHQIYGNKWAELTKFLPGRTDNAIKNHWNSSVKKKLDSYLASGLLAQFQGLPHVVHPSQPMPSSSSTMQQSSGDDSVPKDGIEAEEISECSQGSMIISCSESKTDMPDAVANAREECRMTEESSQGKEPSFIPSCPENYQMAFQEVAVSMQEVPCELGGSSLVLQHNYTHDEGKDAGQGWKMNSSEMPNISSPDMRQLASELFGNCISGNENHEAIPFTLQASVGFDASSSLGIMVSVTDKLENTLIFQDECCRVIHPYAVMDGNFFSENLIKYPDDANCNGSTESVICKQPDHHIPPDPLRTEISETSWSQPFSVLSHLPTDEDALLFGNDPNQFGDLSHGSQEEELAKSSHDGFIYTTDSVETPANDRGNMGLQDEPVQVKDTVKLVPVDVFSCRPSNNLQTCSSMNENPTTPTEQQDTGALFYEPPRFTSLDLPFFSCDLLQSGNDMEQEYSPLGIRKLMASMSSFTPFRLWDSPSWDDSPDALLKSAAKRFACTPSILKKRNRDFLSPMSEKRSEKKLESDMNQESFSSLARDFSRLEVMFSENGNQKESMPSPSSNQKIRSRSSTFNKENMNHGLEKESKQNILENTESDNNNNSQDKIKQWTTNLDAKPKGDCDAANRDVQQSSIVLFDNNMNDLLLFSPDRVGMKSNITPGPGNRAIRSKCSRRFEATSTECADSELSPGNLCSSIVSSPTVSGKKEKSRLITAISAQSAPSSNTMETMAASSGNDTGVENLSIFGETPFKRSMESPSAWKSPWFINSFAPSPRVDTDITIEDIGFFMSPGDRSYDAIGLMKQLSEHTAATYADAQEVLGDETPETIFKSRLSRNQKHDQEKCALQSQPENCSFLASNVLTEPRVLDFSECETPGKAKESGKFSSSISFSSPSSYLLKGCR